jgi:hypothetical protein
MQAARDRVFADYRMHIREVVVDTRVPAEQMLLHPSISSRRERFASGMLLMVESNECA